MTADERAAVLVTARLLRAAQRIDWLTTPLTVLAVALLVMHRGPRWVAIGAIVIGIVAKVYAVRVAFDARLFEDVGEERLTTSGLDSALSPLRNTTPRPWADRCRGARRLIYVLSGLAVLQLIVLAFA